MGKVGLVLTHSFSYLRGMIFTFRSFVDFVYLFVSSIVISGLRTRQMHQLLLMLDHPQCRVPTVVISDLCF